MAGRPRTRAKRAANGGKDFERKSPEQIRAEQSNYRAMVVGFMEELTEDYDAWQVVVNVCQQFGTSISENNLLLMMAQYAGFTPGHLPTSPFADEPHVPTDIRSAPGWFRAGRTPIKGMGVKMWEPVKRDIPDDEAAKLRAEGAKGIRWDESRGKWVRLSFKLGTRWDIEHTVVKDAAVWEASDPRPVREGGDALAKAIADSIFDEFGVDVTIPPTPAERSAPRKPRPAPAARKAPNAKPEDTATFKPPTRKVSRPLFGGPATPPDGPGGGVDTAPPAKPGPEREGTVRAPETHAPALPAGGEGDGPGDGAPTGRDEAFAFLRASGYRGNFVTMTARAFEDITDANIARAERDTRGKLWTEAGQASSLTARDLFTLPMGKVERMASPELHAWWRVNGRYTLAEYRADLVNGSGRAHRAGA